MDNKVYEELGIKYIRPTVYLLQDTGIGTAEYAGRTAYNSFDKSENKVLKNLNDIINKDLILSNNSKVQNAVLKNTIRDVNDIEHSELLDSLAWVHHHHSVLEHSVLTYLIKDVSRGVLQELVRHRLSSPTVKSTRFTMSNIINIFNFCIKFYELSEARNKFIQKLTKMDLLVTPREYYQMLEWSNVFDKLYHQCSQIPRKDWYLETIPKSIIEDFKNSNIEDALGLLNSKQKRNVGDKFKHIVNDNWKVDLVLTINLRTLKNFFDLRDSGAAWFQIRELAKIMKEATPEKYLRLIDKKYKGL